MIQKISRPNFSLDVRKRSVERDFLERAETSIHWVGFRMIIIFVKAGTIIAMIIKNHLIKN